MTKPDGRAWLLPIEPRGLYNEAEETYQLVLRLDDKDPRVWFEIGNLYYDMRDYQLAMMLMKFNYS